jgi:hypothetical protein
MEYTFTSFSGHNELYDNLLTIDLCLLYFLYLKILKYYSHTWSVLILFLLLI